MLKLFPIIIISTTIPLYEPAPIILDKDYSQEARDCYEKNIIKDSQDTSDILYNLILEQLLEEGS
jgi:hypothetical protein